MRVLIITHPRSGGTTLTRWLSKELEYDCINEPDYEEANGRVKLAAESDDNIVAKIFPYRLTQNNIDIDAFIKTYDKVICHLRANPLDVAISLTHSKITRNFNHTYEINNEFLELNKEMISNQIEVVKNFFYQDVKKYNDVNSLYTTYDGVFNSGEDVSKIMNHLNIKELKHNDLIGNDKKYSKSILNINELRKEPNIMKHSALEKNGKTLI
jgi:hypothetical protein